MTIDESTLYYRFEGGKIYGGVDAVIFINDIQYDVELSFSSESGSFGDIKVTQCLYGNVDLRSIFDDAVFKDYEVEIVDYVRNEETPPEP